MTKILAIDDINDNLISLRAVLKDTFPEVEFICALDGYSGIELAKDLNPDIILLDIVMPNLDGFAVCRMIKQNPELTDIPVVFFTALKDRSENRVLALDAGADGFLNKPIDQAELVAQIKAMLKIRAANISKRDEKNKLDKLVEERTRELNYELEKRISIENALRESESKFRIVFESANVGKSITSISGEINVNQSFCDLLGYSKDELKNKKWQEITPLEEISSVQEKLNSLIQGEYDSARFEKRYIHKSGSYIWADASVVIYRDNTGKPLHFITTVIDITERKRAEQAVLDHEIQYRNLANSGSALIWTSGTDRLCNYFNQPWLQYTGRTLEQERGNGWAEGVHPEDFAKCLEIYNSAFDKRVQFYMEYRLRHNSGEYRWISDTGTPNYDSLGNFIGYIGHCFDIEDNKKAERALLNSQKLLTSFIKHSPVYAFIKKSTPENSTVLYASDNFIDMTGFASKDMINKSMYDLFPHEFAKKITDDDWKVVSEGKILTLDEDLNGKNYITIKFPIYQDHEKLLAGYSIDITERKLSEQALKESEYRFRSLHNASFGGIAIHDKGIILDCNQGLSNITGFSQTELLGMNGLLLISDDTRHIVINNIELGYEKAYEVVGVRKDGTRYPLRLEGKNIPYKGLTVRVVEFRDITEQKAVEKDLIKAKEKAEESDRLKSAFLANMSHEIRTPMNGILGFTDLLRIQDLSSDKRDSYIDIIHRSGQRLLDTVNDIIEISKIEAGLVGVKKTEINIIDEIDELFRFFKPQAESKGLCLIFEKPQLNGISKIITDEHKFNSILTNLIKNAIKFTDKGSISVGFHHENNLIKFYVKDTGVGIPENRLQAVFNRFEQADIKDTLAKQGSGLGLAIAKAYVEMLGGSISLESKESRGSVFTFVLPQATDDDFIAQEPETEEAVWREVKLWNRKLNVLVAEDDDISFFYLESILVGVNIQLKRCYTGIEALNEFISNPSYDIILMDIKMPVMTGLEALREIRKTDRKIPIIIQTAYALAGDKEVAFKLGCSDYLAKPIKRDDLLKSISSLLNGHLNYKS